MVRCQNHSHVAVKSRFYDRGCPEAGLARSRRRNIEFGRSEWSGRIRLSWGFALVSYSRNWKA